MLTGFRDFTPARQHHRTRHRGRHRCRVQRSHSRLTEDFIKPLISLIGARARLAGSFTVRGQHFLWADFITAIIHFVIIAAVLYFLVVVPMNKLNEAATPLRADRRVAGARPTDEAVLLGEIRDLPRRPVWPSRTCAAHDRRRNHR